MQRNQSRRRTRTPVIESLETRALLNAAPGIAAGGGVAQPIAIVDAHSHSAALATSTMLRVQAGTLGQAITFNVEVRGPASQGSPTGTVALTDHGVVLQTLTLSPANSPNRRFAVSTASYTIPAGAGGVGYYFGAHSVSAQYTSGGSLRSSHHTARFRVATPHFTTESGGLKVATVTQGAGPAIAPGQTASMLYTGYLFRGGKLFDASILHGGAPFNFTVEASPEQVIPGFDRGTVGMQVGQTRVLEIPAALGYGSQGALPNIPPNAKLVFLITLVGIS